MLSALSYVTAMYIAHKYKKFKFLKYSVSPVNTGDGVVLS